MQRAAAGLAAGLRRRLAAGGSYGARVVLLVGSGDNGGDALYAGARLARRGAGVTAVLLRRSAPTPGGLAALRPAGGRVVGRRRRAADRRAPTSSSTASSASAASGGLRPDAARAGRAAARAAGAACVAVDLPSGVDADTGEVPGRGRARRRDGHLRHVQAGAADRPGRRARRAPSGSSTSGSARTCRRRPTWRPCSTRTWPRCCPCPAPRATSTGAASSASSPGSARYPGAAVLAVAGALRGGAGAVRYVGPRRRTRWSPASRRRWSPTGPPSKAGRVQAWVVGPGLGDGAQAAAAVADVLGRRRAGAGRRGRAAAAGPGARTGRGPPPTLLTPHAGEAAGCSAWPREEVEARPAGRRAGAGRALPARRCCSRARPRWSPDAGDAPGAGQRRPARPGWPRRAAATCCPGSPGRCWPRASPARRRRRSAPTCTGSRPPGLRRGAGRRAGRRGATAAARRGGTSVTAGRRRGQAGRHGSPSECGRGWPPHGPSERLGARCSETSCCADRAACAPAPRSIWPPCAPTSGRCAPVREGAALMAVVKADAYGHGAVPCARAALEAGRDLAGHRHPEEALALRAAGLRGPDHVLAVDARRALAGGRRGRHRRVRQRHVGAARGRRRGPRGGPPRPGPAQGRHRPRPQRLPARRLARAGRRGAAPPRPTGWSAVTGLWSHFACADEPGHPSIAAQLDRLPRDAGVRREGRASSPRCGTSPTPRRTLTLPESHFDLVRTGIAMYGISPSPELGHPGRLRPAAR